VVVWCFLKTDIGHKAIYNLLNATKASKGTSKHIGLVPDMFPVGGPILGRANRVYIKMLGTLNVLSVS
jgi:hypothetical protein